MAKFKFPLQPALDKARAEREKAEKALLAARQALAEARQRLEAAEKKLSELLQQAAAAHDHLVMPQTADSVNAADLANDLRHRRQILDTLRLDAEQQRHAVAESQQALAAAQELTQQRQTELNRTVAQVQSFEKLETKAKQEHQKILERKLQDDIDEAAQHRST